MSEWKALKEDIGKVASKAAATTGRLVDAASVRLRLQSLKLKLCEEYEKLGRMTYRAGKYGEVVDLTAQTKKIDEIHAEMREIKAIPHNSDGADTPSDFSSDETKSRSSQ